MASASQVGQVYHKWVKRVASGSSASSASSASQVGQVRCKWVRCVASGASGNNRLITPTPKQVCQVCQHTCNQLLVPVCTRTAVNPKPIYHLTLNRKPQDALPSSSGQGFGIYTRSEMGLSTTLGVAFWGCP